MARYKSQAGNERPDILRRIITEDKEEQRLFSKSTVCRREHAWDIASVATHLGGQPKHVMDYLVECFKPSTAFTYAITIQSLPEFAHFANDRIWKMRLNKELLPMKNREGSVKRAEPLSIEDVLKIRKSAPPHYELTVFLWITASRYGDLQYMKWLAEVETPVGGLIAVVLCMKGSKGDPVGKRGDAKAVLIPKTWKMLIKGYMTTLEKTEEYPQGELVPRRKEIPSRYHIDKVLKTVGAFTPHSCRRGAVHTLVDQGGFGLINVSYLTLHGQRDRYKLGALPVYSSGNWFKEDREVRQLAQVLFLLEAIELVSNSTTLYLRREWCNSPKDPLQVTPWTKLAT